MPVLRHVRNARGVLIILFVVGIHRHLHCPVQIIFVRGDMNGIAAVAAIFDVVLIITADINSDMCWMPTKWAANCFMD